MSTLQHSLVHVIHGGGGQAHIPGHLTLGNIQRGSSLFMQQLGVEFQSEYVFAFSEQKACIVLGQFQNA